MKTNFSEGLTIWFTGLSGSGKTTTSNLLSRYLDETFRIKVMILDGDIVRNGLNKDLTCSQESTHQNNRRIGQLCKLCNSQGMFVIASVVSPFAADRNIIRKMHLDNHLPFYEIYIGANLQTCQKRDTKGFYKLAKEENDMEKFKAYQIPQNPDLILQYQTESQLQSLKKIISFLQTKGHLKPTNEISTYQIASYLDFEAGIQELNVLQTIHQGWTQLNNVMNQSQIFQCIQSGKVTQGATQFFQNTPLFLICSQDLKLKAEQLIKTTQNRNCNLRIINKINKKQIAVLRSIIFQDFNRKQQFLCKFFKASDNKKQQITKLYQQKRQYIVSGEKLIFKNYQILFHDGLDYLRKSPQEIKKEFVYKKGSCLYAYQSASNLQNRHLFLLQGVKKQLIQRGYQKPVLLLNPCGSKTSYLDLQSTAKQNLNVLLLQNSTLFSREQFILAIWPSPMLCEGSRQCLLYDDLRYKGLVKFMIRDKDPKIKNPEIKNPHKLIQNFYDVNLQNFNLDILQLSQQLYYQGQLNKMKPKINKSFTNQKQIQQIHEQRQTHKQT